MGTSDALDGQTEKILSALKSAIWKRRPVLGDIMQKHGGKILHDYAADFMDVNHAPSLDPGKPEIIETAGALIGERLGKEVGAKVMRQLRKLPLVTTADHHGPIDHPFWVNSNIISAIPFLDHPDPDVFSVIAFSFASVSLNNASGFARGILFHASMNDATGMIRLPIFPDKMKMSIVYGTRGFTREDLDRAETELFQRAKNGEMQQAKAEAVRDVLRTYFAAPEILGTADFCSQVTKINYALWPKLFHTSAEMGKKTSPALPQLIYLEIETVVKELLLRHHLTGDTLLNRFLFMPEYRPLILKYFNNIPGAFSLEKGWGTYLFWGIDRKRHRVRLDLEGETLLSRDHPELSFAFTPEGLAQALRQGNIYPSMLLCYLMVSLYYGMKCLGGFCQVHDLTVTKEAWGALLREIGETKEAQALEPIQTKELGGDGMVLSYKRTASGGLLPGTGIDMLLSDRDTSFEGYAELSKTVTLMEMMQSMLPEMYTVLYSSDQRDQELLSISAEQIIRRTGLDTKLDEEMRRIKA